MQYRRTRIRGGAYFFTVNLADRSATLLTDRIDDLRSVLHDVKRRRPFQIDAMVVLPDHLHAIWTLPPDDCDYAVRWALVKAGFSRRIPAGERRSASQWRKESEVFGSGVIGSMRYVMSTIMPTMWITYTTIL